MRLILLMIGVVMMGVFDIGTTYLYLTDGDTQVTTKNIIMMVGSVAFGISGFALNSCNDNKDKAMIAAVYMLPFLSALMNYGQAVSNFDHSKALQLKRKSIQSMYDETPLYTTDQINKCQNDLVLIGGEWVKMRCRSDDMREHNARILTHNESVNEQLRAIPLDPYVAPTWVDKLTMILRAMAVPFFLVAAGGAFRSKNINLVGNNELINSEKIQKDSKLNSIPEIEQDIELKKIHEFNSEQIELLNSLYIRSGRPKKTAFYNLALQSGIKGIKDRDKLKYWYENMRPKDEETSINPEPLKIVRTEMSGEAKEMYRRQGMTV